MGVSKGLGREEGRLDRLWRILYAHDRALGRDHPGVTKRSHSGGCHLAPTCDGLLERLHQAPHLLCTPQRGYIQPTWGGRYAHV